jgi:high affinity Mn2+ porin
MRGRSYSASARRGVLCGLAFVLVASSLGICVAPAGADDVPASSRGYEWQGFYLGGHAGLGHGTVNATLPEPTASPLSQGFGSGYGGMQAGYNWILPSGWLLGAEFDISFPSSAPFDNVVWSGATPTSALTETIDYVATARARLGYPMGPWLPYATGGFAWSNSHVTRDDLATGAETSQPQTRVGFAAGGGLEYGFAPAWSIRIEYLYTRLGALHASFPPVTGYAANSDLHVVRLGLNYRFGQDMPAAGDKANISGSPNWEFHAQSTFIEEGYPRFPALYSGLNSFAPHAQSRETFSASAFLNARLWQGGELYYNPELFQGFGLSNTTGAGGYPNGEAQKSGFIFPRYSTSRLFLRQTFGFGGEQETLESTINQLSGKADVSRLTLQAGKFSVKDLFDSNSYASDSRTQFMNWSLWAAGAFDYSADKIGLSYGATAELNQKNWALRAGYFLVPDVSNSNNFDTAVFKRGEYIIELEQRYSLFSQPGKLRVTAWLNSTFSGDYRDALLLAAANPGLSPTDAIAQDRRGRIKYGYIFNVEQALTGDIGLFGRWSWNDGRNEIMSFTDIDASLSGGVVVKGKMWGRPDDTIGIGGAINALSKEHREYIAAGGLGILVGDGQLNYRTERVLETYYSILLAKQTTLTLDYQLLLNPAYNADRGPTHVFSLRLHGEL